MNISKNNKLFKIMKKTLLFDFRRLIKESLARRGVATTAYNASVSRRSRVPDDSGRRKASQHSVNLLMPYSFVLHTGEVTAAVPHIAIWLPSFLRSSGRTLIVVRYQKSLISVGNYLFKNNYPADVILCKSEKEIDVLIGRLQGTRACFYPSNTGNNIHLIKHQKIKHIFIGHGDSDKSASAHKFFRVYNQNWVAGQANIDRFQSIARNGLEFVKIGRPTLKAVALEAQPDWSSRFDESVNLLCLPTWEGVYEEQNYSSVSHSKQLLGALKNRFNVGLKFHPMTGSRSSQAKSAINGDFSGLTLYTAEDTIESFIDSYNVFICDISAVVSECLALNGPIFVYLPPDKDVKLAESKMPYTDYCYTYSSVTELLKLLEQVVDNRDDYLAENRKLAMNYILGIEETLQDEFVVQLDKLL
ncbi:CDP-glycerol glycerophosphotransferase family protein [uncultured Microbulbifer sp.]|uniref:CDP-glycerol glycerophosphotransferase family protein n=1 Tax=uncultured Microbulbifer sp. TaxID=348147 RepID=UPI0026372FA0|nr:CDP-glycerol glycerophosphotransferase family protein [uncultured Microbulbifer sp.]